jgi:hypothetical protein
MMRFVDLAATSTAYCLFGGLSRFMIGPDSEVEGNFVKHPYGCCNTADYLPWLSVVVGRCYGEGAGFINEGEQGCVSPGPLPLGVTAYRRWCVTAHRDEI